MKARENWRTVVVSCSGISVDAI